MVALLISVGMFLLFNTNIPTDYSVFGQFTLNLHEIVRVAALVGFLMGRAVDRWILT